MTEQGNNRITILSILVGGLLVAVIVQSAVIFGIHKRTKMPPLEPASQRPEMMTARPTGGLPPPPMQDAPPPPPAQPADHDRDIVFTEPPDGWDPFKEMHAMQENINRMFGSAFDRFRMSDDFGAMFQDYAFAPDINIEDKGENYLVTVDLPGAEDSQIDVKLEGRALTISGSVHQESTTTEKGRILRQERRSGNFHRTVTLPSPVKEDEMTTSNQMGVLHVTIPKAGR